MFVTPRDMSIFEYLYIFHCLTTQQISELLGMGRKICQRRLRVLRDNSYIQNIMIPDLTPGRNPYLFYLGERGASLFNIQPTKPRINWKFSHQQQNNTLLIKIINFFKGSDIICRIMSEHLIRTFGKSNLIPDAAFTLRRQSKQGLFLMENCAGTETLVSPGLNQDIESKIIRYVDVYKNSEIQLFEDFFGVNFQRFRLLFIANSYQRLSAIKEIVNEYDPYCFIWLTTMSAFKKAGILGNIWEFKNEYNQSILG